MPKPKKYMDPRAHSASIAEMARQMAQQRKAQELERSKAEHETESRECGPEDETVWVEAKADNGTPYYFHMYSGVTVWERPENYYTAEQYTMKLAMMENNTDAMAKNQITEPNKLKSELRRHWRQQDIPGMNKSQSKIAKKLPEESNREQISSNIQDPSTSQSTAINEIRENLSEKPQIMKFDPEMDATNFVLNECDIPLPPSSQDSKQQKLALNMAMKEEMSEESSSSRTILNDYSNTGGENVNVKNETENKVIEKTVEEKKSLRSGPYGPWVPVEKLPEKPKVDWELPTEGQGQKRASEPVLAPEDLITFGDKSAVIKRKKIDGPIEFRKRKTMIKTRQPIDDQ
ncbi:unnamed protein product [Onchocerca flexuosa]|uniref:WW domain-containing protein n=1 Tax=Onchocerca flexuosa TaxID=387005 RepID=A0A183HB40_9BILA|nr:unnamed protein product [Onchocerca flexuosa]